jgi:hypothetical protein
MLDSKFLSCQTMAARALYRLGAHTDNQPKIVAAGALPGLIRLCRSPDPEVSKRPPRLGPWGAN